MKKGFLAPLMLGASFTCHAGDYFFKPVFSSNERYHSNLFMRQVPLQDNWISTLSPGLNFGLRHENGELNSNFTWNQLFYTNQTELNIDEQLFSIDYQHKAERFQWGTSASYNNQASTNTQGTVLGGLLFTQVMAKQLNLAPTVTYSLDELSSLSFDYSYNKTTYEKRQNSFLTDYDYHQASGTLNHLYTERDTLNATLSASRYKAQIFEQTTFNYIGQLGWQHSFSEQLVTYISAGINYSQVEATQQIPAHLIEVTTKKTGTGQVYRVSIQKTFERGSVSLVGSQNQTPTSQGLQTITALTINNTYTINERWTSSLSASYSNNVLTGVQNSLLDRTYYTISPSINWRWTPEIKLGLSYTYNQQAYQNNAQSTAQGNSVQLQFSYQPQTNHQVK